MKRLFVFFLMVVGGFFAFAQTASSLDVYILDPTDTDTNVRSAPKGKVVAKIPAEGIWMLAVSKPRNGWWQINNGMYYDAVPDNNPDGDAFISLHGSTTGYWIHSSCIGFGLVGNGSGHKFLAAPDNKARAVYISRIDEQVHPLELRGDWVKVVTLDGKHTGWIPTYLICDNPLTTCP